MDSNVKNIKPKSVIRTVLGLTSATKIAPSAAKQMAQILIMKNNYFIVLL